MGNASYYNVYLGPSDIGEQREKAYTEAAHEAGFQSLAEWLKAIADKASGFKPKPSTR